MKKAARLAVAIMVIVMGMAYLSAQAPFDPKVEDRISSYLSRMTLEEKIGQLNQYSSTFDVTGPPPQSGGDKDRYEQIRQGLVGSMLNVTGVETTRRMQELAVKNSRLGIPMIFGLDVVHGYRTMFPIPLGEAASWDLDALQLSARIAATEAAAAGLHWTFAPMVDIARDARWGRIMEGAGEDPYLGARIAEARVRGFQGSDLAAPDTIAACVKHFAGYGFSESGRDYNTVDISEQTLRNVVLPPFKAAVEAGAATVMNSFNDLDGVPATASVHLQREILKGEWGFRGFVVSDWGSIGEMIPHGVAADTVEAAEMAIKAGSDMDMETSAYIRHLADLVKAGKVDEKLIDDAVRRILRVKFALGLFEDPYRYCDPEREKKVLLSQAHLDAARDVARKSIVLLKNETRLLPLQKKGTIAVIGPLAADKDSPLGNWRAQAIANSAVSLLEGIQAAVGSDAKVVHAEGAKLVTGPRNFFSGSQINTEDRSGFADAVAAARNADVVVMAIGEDAFQSGEGRSQVDIGLKGLQEELLREVFAVNKKIVVVLMTGRPVVINWISENIPAVLESWHLGSQAGHAIADILFGAYNPSGKLPVSFPRHVGQLPLYYNHKNTGRPTGQPSGVLWSAFTDVPNTPLYPFGYGLSYSTFEYSDLRLGAKELSRDGQLQVTVTLKNTGDRPGIEVVQLYTRDLVASVTRPVKELKGFKKISLAAGQSEDVTFAIKASDLAFYTRSGKWEAEAGNFKVFVGGNSRDVQEAEFTLQ